MSEWNQMLKLKYRALLEMNPVERDKRTEKDRVTVEPYASKLAAMESVEEMRQFFVDEGVLGIPKAGRLCAIAQYISERSGCEVSVTGAIRSGVTCQIIGDMTGVMVGFMSKFDEGEYPELVS